MKKANILHQNHQLIVIKVLSINQSSGLIMKIVKTRMLISSEDKSRKISTVKSMADRLLFINSKPVADK